LGPFVTHQPVHNPDPGDYGTCPATGEEYITPGFHSGFFAIDSTYFTAFYKNYPLK
jgi:hypothetical protein